MCVAVHVFVCGSVCCLCFCVWFIVGVAWLVFVCACSGLAVFVCQSPFIGVCCSLSLIWVCLVLLALDGDCLFLFGLCVVVVLVCFVCCGLFGSPCFFEGVWVCLCLCAFVSFRVCMLFVVVCFVLFCLCLFVFVCLLMAIVSC